MKKESRLDLATWFETATAPGGHATRSTVDPLNIRVRSGGLEVRKNFFGAKVMKGLEHHTSRCDRPANCMEIQEGIQKAESNLTDRIMDLDPALGGRASGKRLE
jgi:hypothetical protein